MATGIKFFSKRIIRGCEARGDADSPYLTRYTLTECRWFGIHFHVFHRSDADRELHDHPWPFVSLILWRGYLEETAAGKHRKWPGMLLFRRATHIHRVELVGNKPAATLVITGPVVRKWGFWTNGTWEHWKTYFERMGC